MSGRDNEPISAFFPSIDRNLIADLDRHLRGAQAEAAAASAAPAPAQEQPAAEMELIPDDALARSASRPDVSHVVEAVEQAAHSIMTMTARIDELERHAAHLELGNDKLIDKLASAQRHISDLESQLRAEGERAARLEMVAAQQASRATSLDRDLKAAHVDLARVADAIAATLGASKRT